MLAQSNPPPVPIEWRNLVQSGRDLLIPNPHTGSLPTDGHLRRAISNAYYALFHALAASNASALIGSPSDATTAAAWSRVYRGLDHGTAKRELRRHLHEFSGRARSFSNTFGDLQEVRHSADYDHYATFRSHEAVACLDKAEGAILTYMQAALSERVYIATLTLIRSR